MSIEVEHQSYRFVVACKTCGVVDEAELSREEAVAETSGNPPRIDEDPAFIHYDRTGHTCGRLNYTNAPPDIREMLDGGAPEDLDWRRIAEWLSQSDTFEEDSP